jgi:predicted nucleotidyltransferase
MPVGRQFVGAYLQGSFAVGDFDEDSDVDLLIAEGP